MALTEAAILAYLDEVSELDWPDFRSVSSLEYHAMRLVALRERGTDDWGLVFEAVRGAFIHDYEFAAIGVTAKIYGPSVPTAHINVPAKRPVQLTTSPHAPTDLTLTGVTITGPAGPLVFAPDMIPQLDLRPGKVCNFDGISESPADLLLVRAYLAHHPGCLFGPIADAAGLLGGSADDVVVVTDAFEHVLGRAQPEGDPAVDRYVLRPSEAASYRSLARALVARAPALFAPGPSNLDWRMWARFDDEGVGFTSPT